MVTLTNNSKQQKSAQHRKYIWFIIGNSKLYSIFNVNKENVHNPHELSMELFEREIGICLPFP